MLDRQAVVRSPPPAIRPHGLNIDRVRETSQDSRRTVSAGAVWSVGGVAVTEGVASVSNGRGGRVTSSTNAPHYAADFLRKRASSESNIIHGKRLALALEINPIARVLEHSTPPSPRSDDGSPTIANRPTWKDCKWEREGGSPSPSKRTVREKRVPTVPFRVLDAPGLRDDYYCSLLAYSPTLQCLAVGLGPHVYLWSEARSMYVNNIPDSLVMPHSAHVTSISFSSSAGGRAILAIGRADGRITIWSPFDADPRFDSEQPVPVSCLAFRPTTVRTTSVRDSVTIVETEELLVGDEQGNVYVYNIEWPSNDEQDLFDWHGSMTLLAKIDCHSQQICGMAWAPDGEIFATGGNDNQLFLFQTRKILQQKPSSTTSSTTGDTVPVRYNSTDSSDSNEVQVISIGRQKRVWNLNAAVKAIAFAPWQQTLIAAGGGSNDRCIHLFHTSSGAPVATIDCHAQVTSLVFAPNRRELAATFGFAQPDHPYRVAVFAWPSCKTVAAIPWVGEERALCAVHYPGALAVATSDASIKFHEMWADGWERRRDGRYGQNALGGGSILGGECSFVDDLR